MKILADFHHVDLFYSFQLLFEGRLGHELYRPIGREWVEEDLWDIYNEYPVTDCYLSTERDKAALLVSELPPLGSTPWARYLIEMMKIGHTTHIHDGVYTTADKSKPGVFYKGVTLDKFKRSKFDVIISSVPQHFDRFQQLLKYNPGMKHIFHMGFGNAPWPVPAGARNLLLHSEPLGGVPGGVNRVFYKQEFNTDVFSYTPPEHHNNIISYVYFPESMKLMDDVSNLLKNHSFNLIGNFRGPQAGIMIDSNVLAMQMKASSFTWHIKPGGESYGHCLADTYACGRPAIINKHDYKYKMMGPLLEDKVTCIDVSNRTPEELASVILEFSDPEKHREMCSNAYTRFCEVIDFEGDARNVQRFMEKLQ
jgi:hypothetical protein